MKEAKTWSLLESLSLVQIVRKDGTQLKEYPFDQISEQLNHLFPHLALSPNVLQHVVVYNPMIQYIFSLQRNPTGLLE
jgi:hypothetical protein